MSTSTTTLAPATMFTTGSRRTSRIRPMLWSEWIKLRSVRSTLAVVVLAAATGAALVAGLTTAAPTTAPTIVDALAFPVVFTAVFAAVAGISLFTTEIQHHTLDPLLIAQPRRSIVVGAKSIVAALYGATIALVGQVGGLAAGIAVGAELGAPGAIAAQTAWAAVFAAAASLLGLGVGMIVRHGSAAIAGLLVWWLVVENLVVALAPARWARLLPFVAGNALVGIEMDSPDATLPGTALSSAANLALLVAYVAVALVAGAVLVGRREQG